MAAPFLDLASKLEHAAQDIVANQISGITAAALTGSDDAEKTVPNVQAIAGNFEEDQPHLSNYWATLAIRIASDARAGLAAHRTLMATVFDKFLEDTIASQLSSTDRGINDLHVFGVVETRLTTDNTDTQFVGILELDLYVCGRDLDS